METYKRTLVIFRLFSADVLYTIYSRWTFKVMLTRAGAVHLYFYRPASGQRVCCAAPVIFSNNIFHFYCFKDDVFWGHFPALLDRFIAGGKSRGGYDKQQMTPAARSEPGLGGTQKGRSVPLKWVWRWVRTVCRKKPAELFRDKHTVNTTCLV